MTRVRLDGLCAALVVVELVGYLAMWLPIPVLWMWIGSRVYLATSSLGLDLLVAFGGFGISTLLASRGLSRLDRKWVELRQQAGHDQREGALSRVVIVSTTVLLAAFWVWFHILEEAFVIPFMPTG